MDSDPDDAKTLNMNNGDNNASRKPFKLAPPTLKLEKESHFSPWSSLQSPKKSSKANEQLLYDSSSSNSEEFDFMKECVPVKEDDISSDFSTEKSCDSLSGTPEQKLNAVSTSGQKVDVPNSMDKVPTAQNSDSCEMPATKKLKQDDEIPEDEQKSSNYVAPNLEETSSTESSEKKQSEESNHNINLSAVGENKKPEALPDQGTRPSFTLSSPLKSTHLFGTNSAFSSSGGFVFGENLHERVLSDQPGEISSINTGKLPETFEEAVQKLVKPEKSPITKSLTESAMEFEAAKQSKRKFDEISVISGEENECNVLQMNCKLFVFDNSKSTWVEKGRGVLRLNDQQDNEIIHSRIIIRTQGSLRVILNSKVRPDMTIEQPSPKTVRFSAVDTDGVGIYLVVTQPKGAEDLYKALDSRIAKQKHDLKIRQQNNS